MAWLYLILVLLVFYTPVIGLGSMLLKSDFVIPGTEIAIPFSGTYQVLGYSLLAWYMLWKISRWIEVRTGFDSLYRLDQILRRVNLRRRWLYADRPSFSLRLAEYLAGIGLSIASVKVGGEILLELAQTFILPWFLKSALPALIGRNLPERLTAVVLDQVGNWVHGLQAWNIPIEIPALSILILLAARAFRKERQERYWLDIQRNQRKRKVEQKEIRVP